MKASELRSKDKKELQALLLELRQEQVNLRIQKALGQAARTHRFAEIRRDIARIKTVLNEMNRTGE